MIKIIIFLAILFYFSKENYAQTKQDTLLFTENMQLTNNIDSAKYYGYRQYNKNKYGVTTYHTLSNILYAKQEEKNGKTHGKCIYYNTDGSIFLNAKYKNNKPIEEHQYFDVTGVFVRSEIYNKRHKLKAEYYKSETNKKIYFLADRMSTFGEFKRERKALVEMGVFIKDNLIRPEITEELLEPYIVVSFLVAPSGLLEEVTVENPTHQLAQAAIQVIKKMPKWRPAKHNGQTVYSEFSIVIQF